MQNSPEFDNYFQYIQETFNRGTAIPPLSFEIQERVRTQMQAHEDTINNLFPQAIDEDRRHMASTIQFFDTRSFFQTVIVQGREELLKNKYIHLDMLNRAIDTSGMAEPGKGIFIHTTHFQYDDAHKAFDIRQITEEEGIFASRHELIHGKLREVRHDVSPGIVEIRRGCRVQRVKDGKLVAQTHNELYEAQTDILAVISGHPDVQSWNDILKLYMDEKMPDTSPEEIARVDALCTLMGVVFEDFPEGREVLGSSYFQSDGDRFLQKIGEKITSKGNGEKASLFQKFTESSAADDAIEMKRQIHTLVQ